MTTDNEASNGTENEELKSALNSLEYAMEKIRLAMKVLLEDNNSVRAYKILYDVIEYLTFDD